MSISSLLVLKSLSFSISCGIYLHVLVFVSFLFFSLFCFGSLVCARVCGKQTSRIPREGKEIRHFALPLI